MSGRRQTALMGVDPDRGRRERKNNIVSARQNAREERLNHRRRLDSDATQSQMFDQDALDVRGGAGSLDALQANVRIFQFDRLWLFWDCSRFLLSVVQVIECA
jgi:hypothetical protein